MEFKPKCVWIRKVGGRDFLFTYWNDIYFHFSFFFFFFSRDSIVCSYWHVIESDRFETKSALVFHQDDFRSNCKHILCIQRLRSDWFDHSIEWRNWKCSKTYSVWEFECQFYFWPISSVGYARAKVVFIVEIHFRSPTPHCYGISQNWRISVLFGKGFKYIYIYIYIYKHWRISLTIQNRLM